MYGLFPLLQRDPLADRDDGRLDVANKCDWFVAAHIINISRLIILRAHRLAFAFERGHQRHAMTGSRI